MASATEIERQKVTLQQQMAESRNAVLGAKLLIDEQIANKKAAVAEAVNVPKKVKTAFAEQPAKSFGVALASGLGASLFLKSRSKKKKAAKLAAAAAVPAAKQPFFVSLGLGVLKPLLQKVALQYSQQWLAQRAEQKFAEAQRLRDRS